MEHTFGDLWEQANRCLRQRNRLLRDGTDARQAELAVWSAELVGLANRLDNLRASYFERYQEALETARHALTDLPQVECRYYRGWDATQDLAEVLKAQEESDVRRGYTQSGPHRADVRVRVKGENVANVCSRGELKILAWAMVLAQGWLLSAGHQAEPVYLVDDLASELDRDHRRAVCRWLAGTGSQVLVTGVDREVLVESWGKVPLKMFHVEHGQVEFEEVCNER